MTNPLENAQVNDALAIRRYGSLEKRTVARVTKTQIIDNKGARWNKKTGTRVGASPFKDGFASVWEKQHTAEVERVQRKNEWLKLMGKLDKARKRCPSPEQLQLLRDLAQNLGVDEV